MMAFAVSLDQRSKIEKLSWPPHWPRILIGTLFRNCIALAPAPFGGGENPCRYSCMKVAKAMIGVKSAYLPAYREGLFTYMGDSAETGGFIHLQEGA